MSTRRAKRQEKLQKQKSIYEDIKKRFNEFDTDSSGCLEQDEFVSAVRGMCTDLTEDQINHVWNKMDKNADGSLQLQEFLTYVSNMYLKYPHESADKLIYHAIMDNAKKNIDKVLDDFGVIRGLEAEIDLPIFRGICMQLNIHLLQSDFEKLYRKFKMKSFNANARQTLVDILVSAEDADVTSVVTLLMQEFNRMDADKSGMIDQKEFESALNKIKGITPTRADMNLLWARLTEHSLTSDNPDSVDLGDFLEFISGAYRSHPIDSMAELYQVAIKDARLFNEKLARLQGEGGHTKLKSRDQDEVLQEIIATFNKHDADGSGCIDREEFEDLLSDYAIGLSKAELKKVWRKLDLDYSGYLELTEFIHFLSGQFIKHRGAPTDELLRTAIMDIGRINIDEVLDDYGIDEMMMDALDEMTFLLLVQGMEIEKTDEEVQQIHADVIEPDDDFTMPKLKKLLDKMLHGQKIADKKRKKKRKREKQIIRDHLENHGDNLSNTMANEFKEYELDDKVAVYSVNRQTWFKDGLVVEIRKGRILVQYDIQGENCREKKITPETLSDFRLLRALHPKKAVTEQSFFQWLDSTFDTHDADRDGALSRTEFQRFVRELGVRSKELENNLIFNALDQNSNGLCDRSELQIALGQYYLDNGGNASRAFKFLIDDILNKRPIKYMVAGAGPQKLTQKQEDLRTLARNALKGAYTGSTKNVTRRHESTTDTTGLEEWLKRIRLDQYYKKLVLYGISSPKELVYMKGKIDEIARKCMMKQRHADRLKQYVARLASKGRE